MAKIFLTGAAGFIGFHLGKKLLERGDKLFGYDNFNNYYDTNLKETRAQILQSLGATIIRGDLNDFPKLEKSIQEATPQAIVHLAAQAGVRYSLDEPESYLKSNLSGFLNILESCRKRPTTPLIYASSSSVYGCNRSLPWREEDRTDHPKNFYGATKKANEIMAWSYHHLFNIPMCGLRFFTVYGPWGRPDMAYYRFATAILAGTPIPLYLGDKEADTLRRDFTYVDDIIDGVLAAIDRHRTGYELYNLGHSKPETVLDLLRLLEKNLGKKARIELLPLPKGDVEETYASIEKSHRDLHFLPKVSLEEGIDRFCRWFLNYSAQ